MDTVSLINVSRGMLRLEGNHKQCCCRSGTCICHEDLVYIIPAQGSVKAVPSSFILCDDVQRAIAAGHLIVRQTPRVVGAVKEKPKKRTKRPSAGRR